MAPHHLVVNFAHHIGYVEALLFARNFGMKDHLQQKIAHLLGELGVVTGIERVDHFIRFFNQVRAQCCVGLLAVPGTTLWGAKALLHGNEFLEPFASGNGVGAG